MEILAYILIIYFGGMFITTVIVKIFDPYGNYLDESINSVVWPIAFLCWFLFALAGLVRTLVDMLFD